MKKFKRILSIVLVCAMALCILTACSGSTSGGGSFSNTEEQKAISIINSARKANGENELTEKQELSIASQKLLNVYLLMEDHKITSDEYNKQASAIMNEYFTNYHAYGCGVLDSDDLASLTNNSPAVNASGTYIGCSTGEAGGATYYAYIISK